MIPLRDRCTILRPIWIEDEFSSEPVFGGYQPDEKPTFCAMSPLGSSETVGTRQTVETRYRMLIGSRVALSSTDRVRWHGEDYLVDGDVERHALAETVHHLEVIVRRVTG